MTITAKFPSRCACCGGAIRVGDQIEWTKGSPARHPRCAGKTPTTTAPARAAAKTARKAPAKKVDTTGCTYLSRQSKSRDDGYDVGQVLRAAAVAGGGGDGHYWTVVSVMRKWKDDDTDEWMIACWARPSTAAECGQKLTARAEKADSEAVLKELEQLCAAGVSTPELDVRRPNGRDVTIRPGVHGSGTTIATLTEDGAVALWCAGFYDDYRQSLVTTRDPRALEIMAGLLGIALPVNSPALANAAEPAIELAEKAFAR